MKTLRVVTARKNEKTGKTYWTRIGSAWQRDGGKISILLDALPLGNEIMIFPPDERDGAQGNQGGQGGDDLPY